MAKGRQKKFERVAPVAGGPSSDVTLGYLAGHTIAKSFHKSLFDLIGYDLSGPRRLLGWADATAGALQIPDARNKLCRELLNGSAQWLFMVDSDMGFEPNTLDRLLEVADPQIRPVVGGLCFSQRELASDGMGGMFTFPSPTLLNWTQQDDGVFRFVGRDHYPVNTMIQVGATGGACILIHRSVLEKIDSNWFTLKPGKDGKLQGEDISFCDRCRELDIPVWVHTGIRTTHYKHFWLAESDFWASRVAQPATETVDVIVPTLGQRPDNVPRLLRSLRASTGLARAHYVVEPGDVDTAALVASEGGAVIFHPGTFAEKVNHAYRLLGEKSPAPWVLLVGDDVSFRPAWVDQAQDVGQRWNGQVVGTNDLLNPRVMAGEHATHPMIRRSYVDEVGASWDGPGIVCHEGYRHWFVDDEIVSAAKLRGAFQAALASYVEHHHPMGGKTANDAVYRKGQASLEADKVLFRKRLRAAVADVESRRAVHAQ